MVGKFTLYFYLLVEEVEGKTVSALQSARKKIRHEIQDLNDRLKQSKEAILHFKEEIRKLEDPEGKDKD